MSTEDITEEFEGKNLVELLDMLEPVPEPPPRHIYVAGNASVDLA